MSLNILSPSCGLQGSFAKEGECSSCCNANPAFSALTARSQEQAARHPAPTRCGRYCSFRHFLTGRFVRVENGELSFLLSFSYHCCHRAPSGHQLPPSPFYNWSGNFMDYFDIAIQAQWAVRILPLPKPPLFPPFNLHLQISGHIKVTNSSWNFFLLEIARWGNLNLVHIVFYLVCLVFTVWRFLFIGVF